METFTPRKEGVVIGGCNCLEYCLPSGERRQAFVGWFLNSAGRLGTGCDEKKKGLQIRRPGYPLPQAANCSRPITETCRPGFLSGKVSELGVDAPKWLGCLRTQSLGLLFPLGRKRCQMGWLREQPGPKFHKLWNVCLVTTLSLVSPGPQEASLGSYLHQVLLPVRLVEYFSTNHYWVESFQCQK